jgi:hypothetical protein
MIIYVDANALFTQAADATRTPAQSVIKHVRSLHLAGVELYCWSAAGGAFCEEVVREMGLEACFRACLPKPNVIIDRERVTEWTSLVHSHPSDCRFRTITDYQRELLISR